MGANTSTVQNTPTAVAAPFASNTSQQVVKDLPAQAAPYLSNIASEAQSKYIQNAPETGIINQGGYTNPYQLGNAYLTGSPNGITGQMQTGLNQYQQLFNQAQPLASNTSGALTDTQNAILDQNAQRISDRQASLYSGAGRYGSFGAGIGTARGIAETNNPLMAQYNQQNIGNSLAAMGVQQGATAGSMNAQSQALQDWQRQQGLQAGNLNLAIAPELANQQSLQNYAQTLATMYPILANTGTITTNGNTSGFQTNTPTGTSTTSTPTPWTTYAGLGLAGVGALSDRRLKTDIVKLGKDPHTSLNMYAFRYKGDPKSYPKTVGPMAQEVQKKYPEAVGELPGGILYLKKKVA